MSRTPSTRPHLHLRPEAWEYLKGYEHYSGAVRALESYFLPTPQDECPSTADLTLADSIASALEPVCYTSDYDCPYFASVLTNTDIEDDRAFYGSLGIAQDQTIVIGGATERKLETHYGLVDGEENTPTLCLLTNFNDDGDVELMDEYISNDDRKVYEAAGRIIEGIGTVVGGHLCADDRVSRIVFTFAKSPTSAWVGVLTVSIET